MGEREETETNTHECDHFLSLTSNIPLVFKLMLRFCIPVFYGCFYLLISNTLGHPLTSPANTQASEHGKKEKKNSVLFHYFIIYI